MLAAGQGTRMRSSGPKVLHSIGGQTLLERVLSVAEALGPTSVTVVVGHMAEQVEALVQARGHATVRQHEQLGTAHAVLQAQSVLSGQSGTLLLLSGDVPLLESHTLRNLLDVHAGAGAAASVVTANMSDPFGYGRVIRREGTIVRIVEERDASPEEKAVTEINAGVYAFELPVLWEGLREIAPANAQGEFYLTDLVQVFRRWGRAVATLCVEDASSIRGINNRSELAEAAKHVRQRKHEELMAAGVTLIDPDSTYIDSAVEVGQDSVIHPGVVLEGSTRIGAACEIHAYVRIRNGVLGDRVTVNNFCVLVDTEVGADSAVGPFAHLRPGTVIGPKGKVGSFVELKKTTLGPGSKVNHLSYLGDAQVGADVNVGAGTITCNYDGKKKHQTVIEDGAFIGSGTQLVAPVTVGKGAYVAAGSSITENVPAQALGVARQRQHNVEGWARRPGRSKD
ncbi:MAG: bifunctional UDP-N-acetylglucosamine diphosphorylase/glucosamine-1-phosphate N-acetyltransferase GlmU [Vicinamibacterales bacterium]|nr:bifunctional UDP-N-acetylglucosamine diphosphorylase/glucosamine-1-phosphate N-acetyltransferase GlmU [Vicinamibacterales bacterium]